MQRKNAVPIGKGTAVIDEQTLRQLCESKNMSADMIAASLDVPTETVCQWFDGIRIPEAKETALLAYCLGCSLTRIYGAIINTPCPKLYSSVL